MICLTSSPTKEPYFTAWHLKGWNWRSLRGRGCGQTSATVCLPYRSLVSDFLTFLYLIFTILKSETGASEQGGCVWGTPLRSHRDWVQKSQACAFEESGSGEINPCDPAAPGEIWLSVEQRCCRGQCRPEQVQPPLAYLRAPLSTKLPWSKSAESGVKNLFTIRGGQGLEDRIMPQSFKRQGSKIISRYQYQEH